MRAFQAMRYGRRTASTSNDSDQSMDHLSNSFLLTKRRCSMSSYSNENYQDIQLSKRTDKTCKTRKSDLLARWMNVKLTTYEKYCFFSSTTKEAYTTCKYEFSFATITSSTTRF
ncbi:hypothetical protein I4U23_002878 [Adineta vaga]|nr:hypothetical protein I4U23_002878 [Adineta vaga]